MSDNVQVENGYASKSSSDGPAVRNAAGVPSSPDESWCAVVGSEEDPGVRSQRRHYKDFNKSTVFDYLKSPSAPAAPPPVQEPDADHQVNLEHKQKRHFENVNQSSLDL